MKKGIEYRAHRDGDVVVGGPWWCKLWEPHKVTAEAHKFSAPRMAAAVLSECGRYRYLLTRTLPEIDGPCVTFIMFNPSTADAVKDDPTVRRCMAFARRWGAGSLSVVNLFALRATDPREIGKCAAAGGDPRGPENLAYVKRACRTGDVICAWGDRGARDRSGETMLEWLKAQGVRPQALRMTTRGHPAHPLYVPGDVRPLPL